MVDCANCYRVDTIRVTVEIALVFMPSTVTARENEYRPFSISPIVDAFCEGFPDKITGSAHSLAIVFRSPAAAIDANLVVTIIERRGLVNNGDAAT